MSPAESMDYLKDRFRLIRIFVGLVMARSEFSGGAGTFQGVLEFQIGSPSSAHIYPDRLWPVYDPEF